MKKRFAVLEAGTANPRAYERLGGYGDMFIRLLAEPGESWDVHDVEHGRFPADPGLYAGFVITGSRYSVYDDVPWIRELETCVRRIQEAGSRLLGVCFGHQVIARALGGEVDLNPAGWDAGVRPVRLTDAGRAHPLLRGAHNPIHILEVHKDRVSRLPPGAEHLAFSERTPFEMFSIGSSVFSLQGHPEYDAEVVAEGIERFRNEGHMPVDRAEEALASLGRRPDRPFLQGLLKAFLKGCTP